MHIATFPCVGGEADRIIANDEIDLLKGILQYVLARANDCSTDERAAIVKAAANTDISLMLALYAEANPHLPPPQISKTVDSPVRTQE